LVPREEHLHGTANGALGAEDFMQTPLEELVEKVASGQVPIQVGKMFRLEQVAEAHRCMEENKAGGKIVILT
jgi:NADPH:quinone reductase-like Zn-dependent oxidoreductase